MCNSIGILQQSAPTFAFDGTGQTEIEQEGIVEVLYLYMLFFVFSNSLCILLYIYIYSSTANKECIYFAEMCNLFAQLIARTVKDIDSLVDSLPTDDSSLHSQVCICIDNCILCIASHCSY